MNILLWAPYGAGEHYWGPGISAFRLYKTGLPNKVNLYLAHGFNNQQEYSKIFKKQFFIKGLKKNSRVSQILFLIYSYFWIKKNYNKFDVVHVLGTHEIQFRPALWFENKGVPTFCKVTAEKSGIRGSSKLSKFLGISRNRKKNLNKISGYISISNAIKNSLMEAKVIESKIHSIPNGVDIVKFKPVNKNDKTHIRDLIGLNNTFTVLFIGGISSRKQPSLLVKAIEELFKEYKLALQLILLGPDRDKKELKKIKSYIEKHNLSNVIYIDYSYEPEKYYQAADIFCLPSKSEGMSNALLEAMSSGLPCLVTPISGSIDLITHKFNGCLIENINDIKNSIRELYSNPALIQKYGLNARTKIVDNYSSSTVLNSHLKLFKGHISASK